MTFQLPAFHPPEFSVPPLCHAPLARFEAVRHQGVAPDGYHATSIFPEYYQLAPGRWQLPRDARMDCVTVLKRDGSLDVREMRRLKVGDQVACGRRENGEDGILVYTEGFHKPDPAREKFAFRTLVTRESSFSSDYDQLRALLDYERERGFILWVLGPAVAFDEDARCAFARLIHNGYVHGLLAGNALPTHDVEAAMFGTALGQDIYTRQQTEAGHYKHLDALNTIRRLGSLRRAVERGVITNGIVHALIETGTPHVFAGSIRDDGPLPEVIGDCCLAQDAMRALTRQATTVITLATQLHSIATGNLTASYRVLEDGNIRPVYFYCVDMSEFATAKLANRGSLSARAILTNAQDFIVTLERGLRE